MDTKVASTGVQDKRNRACNSSSTTMPGSLFKREQNYCEIRPESQRRARGGKKVAISKPPGRPTMNHSKEQRVEQDQHRHRTSGRTSKDHAGKKVEWSKQYAINTKRKQDYLDREAEKDAKSAEFLGLPPDDVLLAEGSYFWSDESLDINGLLGRNLSLLNGIRTTYEVYIDFVESLSCIRLRSKSPQNIRSGMSRIKAKIQHAREDIALRAPIYIVEPPSVDAMRTEVSPIFQDSQRVESPSIVISIVLSGLLLTTQQQEAWEVERKLIMKYVQDRFSAHIAKGLAELCTLNKAMRMRVNFGKIHLNRYRKELKNEGYSFQKFSRMMDEFCTLGKFEGILREISAVGKILDMFSSASSIFEPTDSLTSSLGDIKAKHSLLVIAHRSSRESIQVETDIDIAQPGAHGNARNDAGWQIGAMRCFSDWFNARKTHLAVGLISVEYNFDSCLEITTEDVITQPPKAFRNLFENCIRGTLTFSTEKCTLLYPAVRLIAPHGIVVDKMSVTSALHYKLKGTSYIVEVAISHEWDGNDTTRDPSTSCRVSFYHKDWDVFMIAGNSSEGGKGVDMKLLFPDESSVDDGIVQFFAHVQTLRQFVSHVWDASRS